ncbi:MAG TPA: methyl-accepting chemotaxis protein, partial [Nitrospirota bacterium]
MLKGLKYKFGLLVFIFAVLWASLGIYLNNFRYQSLMDGEVVRDSGRIARAVAMGISMSPTTDYTQIESQLANLLTENRDIAYIKIQDSSKATIKEAGVKDIAGINFTEERINAGGLANGTVTVGVMRDELKQPMEKHFIWLVPVTAFLALGTLFVMIYAFNNMILVPLSRMNLILKGMSAGGGDLTQRLEITTRDEIGETAALLNSFLDTLRGLVAGAQDSAFHLLTLTEKIGSKSRDFMSSAHDQAIATNENFRSIGRMNQSMTDVAGSVDSLNINAADSSATVTEMAAQVDVVADSTIDLSGHVEDATSSITEMSLSIKEVAENVSVLADLASQTAGAINKIEISIKGVEEKAKESASLSQKVSEEAASLGNEAMARTIEGMERIRETVDEASGVIERLGTKSKEVGRIVKVIDEVTNQTSLLALNAAILAAQAGEHGKGFAVVANEIKELAERTSSSTGEIVKLITAVQKEAEVAVDSMRLGRERVIEGAQLAYGAADALTGMLESSNR